MKKIINVCITSGGTREYIDDVRVLTNISSGKLGATIAETFARKNALQRNFNYRIFYVCSKGSVLPFNGTKQTIVDNSILTYYIKDTKDLMQKMQELVPKADIVIHSMAVSDFGFKPTNIKLRSNSAEEFIKSMQERIFKNPKILSHIKQWNPYTFLTSFKFEVARIHSDLIRIATESMKNANGDLVVANDKKEIQLRNSHVAYIIDKNGDEIICKDKKDIAKKLVACIEEKLGFFNT